MSKLNVKTAPVFTHEGGKASKTAPAEELRRTLLTCLLWEDTFYEGGSSVSSRIAALVPKVDPDVVANLAIEARSKFQLRHAPLFLVRELARIKGMGQHVERALYQVIQRPDEMGEFLAIYWKDKKDAPISAAIKRALAAAFKKFSPYQLAKYNTPKEIKLKDVLNLVHPKPDTPEQSATWKKLLEGELESPDTWEVQLSAGKDKKETFERLMTEGKLGGLATLRNLRNMLGAGVSESLIRERLGQGIERALPFRFITAARYAPSIEDAIEVAMFKAAEGLDKLPGKTGLLIDVSGSMDQRLSMKSEATRLETANGLAILLRETAESVAVATFSTKVAHVPPRRGFALRDAINTSQNHSSTILKGALSLLKGQLQWQGLERIIIITDEQSSDGILEAWLPKSYVVNVGSYSNGVGYDQGWQHINGWSERVIDYIRALEG